MYTRNETISLIDAVKTTGVSKEIIKRMIVSGAVKAEAKMRTHSTRYRIPISELDKIKNNKTDFYKSNMW